MQRPCLVPGLMRRGLWLLLLLPFLAASLLPQDVMVARGGDGQITMVLCSPEGPQEMVIDLATGEPMKGEKTTTCDWAAAQMAALPTGPLVLAATAMAPVPLHLARTHALRRAALSPLRPQSRAPPVRM